MYRHILVPLDGSPIAEEAIPYALELRRISKGTIALARVVPSAVEPPALYSMTDAETWQFRQRQMIEEAEAYLAKMVARPDMAAAHPHIHVADGAVGYCLLALIERENIDILVMATRRRRHLARWVLGSVADTLVQQAPVPVLLVRHHES